MPLIYFRGHITFESNAIKQRHKTSYGQPRPEVCVFIIILDCCRASTPAHRVQIRCGAWEKQIKYDFGFQDRRDHRTSHPTYGHRGNSQTKLHIRIWVSVDLIVAPYLTHSLRRHPTILRGLKEIWLQIWASATVIVLTSNEQQWM